MLDYKNLNRNQIPPLFSEAAITIKKTFAINLLLEFC